VTPELHPNQFQVNEVWIAFQLNETPISTGKDGAFNCICLMDGRKLLPLGYRANFHFGSGTHHKGRLAIG
jgi:hypothetical protein